MGQTGDGKGPLKGTITLCGIVSAFDSLAFFPLT